MLYGNDYLSFRKFFHQAWEKFTKKQPLDPMESIAATIISNHPEFHDFFSSMDSLEAVITPESGNINPYLHVAHHLAIIEQINSNSPVGARTIYQQLIKREKDEHLVQHLMMSVLAEWLSDISNSRKEMNEHDYISALKKL